MISVIIPVFNGEHYLANAIHSVRQQQQVEFEIIVVDDGSTDGTAELVLTLGEDIRYFFQTNQGPSAARNAGIKVAKGEIIAFLDVDDVWPSGRLILLLNRLQDNPALDIVLGRVRYTGELTKKDREIKFEDSENVVAIPSLGSGIYRKNVFDKIGLLDEELFHYEDYEWFMRVRENEICMLIIKDITYIYQRRLGSLSNDDISHAKHLMKILKLSLNRRKKKHQGVIPTILEFSDYFEWKMS